MKKLYKLIFSFILIVLCFGMVSLPKTLSFADLSENSEEMGTIYVENFNELNNALKTGNENKKIVLDNDIVLSSSDSITNNMTSFSGVFDGNGHAIENLNIPSNDVYYGLFPNANGATIKNLKIKGDVKFSFDQGNTQEVYAGVLVGYGKNVIIENCELDVGVISDNENIYSNVNLGGFAGWLEGESNKTSTLIKNCLSYYDMSLTMIRNAAMNVGGLVGVLKWSGVANSLCYGNINVESDLLAAPEIDNYQNLGGIVGYFIGSSNSYIQNNCFGGDISYGNVGSEGLNVNAGAIIGAVSSSGTTDSQKINFDYWVEDVLTCVGGGLIVENDKTKPVTEIARPGTEGFFSRIDQEFLRVNNLFSSPWNFDTTWITREGIHLQRFEKFEFTLSNSYDTDVISNIVFDKSPATYDFDENVTITITLNEGLGQYYEVQSVMLNSINTTLKGTANGDQITVTFAANGSTEGEYSFIMASKPFQCEVATANNVQGGVKLVDSASTVDRLNLTFYYGTTKKITAVGKGIYSFLEWNLYYKNGEEWNEEPEYFESTQTTVTIDFGRAPFDKEFKIEAIFTDQDAVEFSVPDFEGNKIEKVFINGETYDGTPVKISPRSVSTFDIVVKKGFKLNSDKMIENLNYLYGSDAFELNSVSQNQENGETTYKFNLFMANVSESTEQIEIDLDVENDQTTGGGLGFVIFIIIGVVVLAVGVVVLIIVLKKKGGKRGGKSKKISQKKQTYDDYYI